MSDNAPLEDLWLLPTLEAIQSLPRNVAVFPIPPGYEEEVRAEIGIPLSLPAVYIRVKGLPRWQGYTFDLIGTPLADTPHGARAPLFHLRADIGSESFWWAEQIRNMSIEPLVAWRRRVFCPNTPVYVETKWHPSMGDRTDLRGLEKNSRQNAVKKAWKGIKLLQEVSLGGRPNNAKAVPEELFRSKYAEIYKQLWEKTGDRPTQDQVAYKFGIGERTLRDYLDDYELSWPPT